MGSSFSYHIRAMITISPQLSNCSFSNFNSLTIYTTWGVHFGKWGKKGNFNFLMFRGLIFPISNFKAFQAASCIFQLTIFWKNCLPLCGSDFWMTGRALLNQEVPVITVPEEKRTDKFANFSLTVWDRAYNSSLIHLIIQQMFNELLWCFRHKARP